MTRAIVTVTLAAVGLMTDCPAFAQQQPKSPVPVQGQLQAQSKAQRQVQTVRPMYQRGDTWYEFLLKQFNPSNFDYGAWMEERRQVFLNESVRNPYFNYSLGTTIALLVLAMLYTKQWIDHRRAMWITAEMMTDLYNHDAYSRGVAREAIQTYNDHIEGRNRAIEAAEHGMSIPGADSDTNDLKTQLQSVADERDSYKRERDLAKRDLLEKDKLIAEMSLRVDAVAKKTDPNQVTSSSVDMSAADPKLVQLINNLQEQLYAERRENRRLKGA
jgi:hypothetical protein